ncbi:putative cytoplasmic protein [Thermodesulfobium narugense DSM 14796]|uniref:Putative cytoplasmic protein n=1 Tax=Thermodesulfobium narugense DSM 14796 TaxID=747365 RepID=M1E796_9BACT|nr:DsrE family protein [Thermodesulfobium narugense]AEE14553.1 putative cytoplasmic protein [Thermodesulfobium narugense DSM 14796]
MKKVVIFAFRGDSMCFIHVLLYGIELSQNGIDTRIVLEGESTKLIPELYNENGPLFNLAQKALKLNLFEGVCKACSTMMGTIEDAKKRSFNILSDMSGHAGMARFINEGFEVITF